MPHKLIAGAGKAEIKITEEMLPTPEGYDRIHDLPCARVLLLECGERCAFIFMELVSVTKDVTDTLKAIVSEETGIPPENIWQNVTHSLETPHGWREDKIESDAERRKCELYNKARLSAVREAAREAVRTKREALFASGTGYCEVNTNRIIETKEGYWHGRNDEGPCDHSVPAMILKDKDGGVIAVLFNYHCQPAVMDMSRTADGGRAITADLAGAASRYVEEYYPGAVAIYGTGAGGDEWPANRAVRWKLMPDGSALQIDIHEAAFPLVDIAGEALGTSVVKALKGLECHELTEDIKVMHESLTLPGQRIMETWLIGPAKVHECVPIGDVTTPVELVAIGDTVLVGVKPELDCETELRIKEGSPFKTNMLMTFTNGGGKYLVKKEYHDKVTYQSQNSTFMPGAAELFAERVRSLVASL